MAVFELNLDDSIAEVLSSAAIINNMPTDVLLKSQSIDQIVMSNLRQAVEESFLLNARHKALLITLNANRSK